MHPAGCRRFVLSSAWVRTAQADETGTLTVALSNNPVTCDPINMSSHDTQILSQTIFENLVEFDIEGNLRPQLAKALPEISADALVYTFDLRDDVLFQDGTPMTSEDVKYSIEYTINPANKASRGADLQSPVACGDRRPAPGARASEGAVRAVDLVPDQVHGHLARRIARETTATTTSACTPKDVGTGPGIFEEWKPNDYVSFRRNPHYWQKGLPHWDRLVVKVVPEDATRVAYLLERPGGHHRRPAAARIQPPEDPQGHPGRARCRPSAAGRVHVPEPDPPPFDDLEFRKAIAARGGPQDDRREDLLRPGRSPPAFPPRPRAGGTTRRPTT